MTPHTLWSLISLSVFATLVWAQGPVQSFFPASIPLSVRSPYISVWDISTKGSNSIANSWPHFWGQQSIMGWAGKIRVDGQTYAWMGQDGVGNGPANVTNVQITPTRSIFVMQAGPMNVTVTYLSPIEPDDWVKQSMPFSYVYVEAASTDGNSHSIQLYSDISAEWLSGNRSALVKWTTQSTGSSQIHAIELQNPQTNVEITNQASDGKAYYAMAAQSGLTWQIDTDGTSRKQFADQGTLGNIASSAFGPISNPFPVYSLSVDLGQIQSTAKPVAWSVGYVRDPSVQYTLPTGETQNRRPLFMSQFSNINDAIDAFTGDFSAALTRALALDQKIMGEAAKISQKYVDLVSLGTRQTFGSLDITVFSDSKGTVDPSDIKIFMKDIGYSQRVSPVERIYAAFPTYLYLNASFAGAILMPLLQSQDNLSGQQYAIQDIGTSYPIASGAHGAHNQGIEQSGNMLIMMYAHARYSGDGTLIAQHYNLTKRWADYLVENTLAPNNQQSADKQNIANMTNLAIKGIIGVKAMAEISRVLGVDFDAQQYDSHASALIGSWQSLAQSTTQQRLLGVYDNQQSWALMYNLYADLLLGTKLIPQSLLDAQAQFYSNLLPTAPTFGLPIDSDAGSQASAAWTLLTAATVSDTGVRDALIEGVWNRVSSNATLGAFPDGYDSASGALLSGGSGNAGAALGAMFSQLALTLTNQTIVVPNGVEHGGDDGNGSSDNKSNIGAIVGGIIGGVAVVGIAVVAFLVWRRHKQRQADDGEKVEIIEEPHRPSLQPFYSALNQNPTSQSFGGPSPHVAGSPRGAGSDYAGGNSQYTDPGVAGLGAAAMGAFDPSPGHSPNSAYAADAYATNAYDSPRPTVGMSAKARERALNQTPNYAASAYTESSATQSASSRDPLSPRSRSTRTGDGSVSISPTDVIGLRTEVENLRRVMQELRAERFEPPPEYDA